MPRKKAIPSAIRDPPSECNLSDSVTSEQELCNYKLDPETATILQMHLFKNVKNVEEIRRNLMNGSWKCTIIKPALILDPLQVAVAANRAVLSEKFGTMTTRNVYTEILFNLSLTKNISQSLSKFGIEKDTNMLVGFLITSSQNTSEEILPKIDGELCTMGTLFDLRDLKKIKNVYKLDNLKCEGNLKETLNIMISRMATKNIIAY